MSLLKIENLSKTFTAAENKVVALNSINLSIEKGEIIAIVGPSGSGKSTLLNILGLLDTLDTGTYEINGIDVKNLKDSDLASYRNKHFGFIVQHFALINHFSVYDNVEIPLEYGHVKKSLRKEMILNTLDKLGLSAKKNILCKNLSGGQAQRVAIARALINNPEVILADEPTGSLDSKTSQEIINLLKEINKQGKTVIIITHDNTVAMQCDKIINIIDGNLTI